MYLKLDKLPMFVFQCCVNQTFDRNERNFSSVIVEQELITLNSSFEVF